MEEKKYITTEAGAKNVELVSGAKVTIEPSDIDGKGERTRVTIEYEGTQVGPDDYVVLGKILENTDNKMAEYQQSTATKGKEDTKEGCGSGCIKLIGTVTAVALLFGAVLERCGPQPPTTTTEPYTEIAIQQEVDVVWEGSVNCIYTTDGFTADYGYFNDLDGTIYYPENPAQLEGIYNESDFLEYQKLTNKTFGSNTTESEEATLSDIAKLSNYRYRDDPKSWKCTIDVGESLRRTFEEQNRIEEAARLEAKDVVFGDDTLNLGLAHIDSIDRQKRKTEANLELAGKMDEWGNVLEQAMADLEDGSNHISSVSSQISEVRTDRISGNVDIEIEGVVRSEFTCTGETQEEVWQQIQAFYEEYQAYTDGQMGMTTSIHRIINNGDKEETNCIFREGRIDGNINDLIKRTIESYSLEFPAEIELPESTQPVTNTIISEEEVRDTVTKTTGKLLRNVTEWFNNWVKPKSTHEQDFEK